MEEDAEQDQVVCLCREEAIHSLNEMSKSFRWIRSARLMRSKYPDR